MVLNLPLMSALITLTFGNQREKEKEKKRPKETPTSDRKPKKAKKQDHLKKTSLGPLRQGQRLDTSETKPRSSKEHKPPKHTRAPPTYMQLPHEPKHTPLDLCMLNSQNLSHRFPKPVQPVFFNISLQNRSHQFPKPVQLVFFSSTLPKAKNAKEMHKLPLDS
jgi:hypothetical protein